MKAIARTLIAIAAGAVVIVPFMRQHPPVSPPRKQSVQVNASPASSNAGVNKAEVGADTWHYRPAPATRQVQQAVDDIIRRHKGLTKEQLQRIPELNKLMDRFIAVMNMPGMQEEINQRLAAIPPVKRSQHGTVRMDFEMLDDAHGRAWLEAAVSEDPQLIEDWILNTLDGAIFEFAFDPDLERTSNGVSVMSAPEPESSAPQNPKSP